MFEENNLFAGIAANGAILCDFVTSNLDQSETYFAQKLSFGRFTYLAGNSRHIKPLEERKRVMLFHANQQTSVTAMSMCNATGGVFVCADTRGLLVAQRACLRLASIRENTISSRQNSKHFSRHGILSRVAWKKGVFPLRAANENIDQEGVVKKYAYNSIR